jgi:uncharacterized membrane protein HdeD (DUF308 family)
LIKLIAMELKSYDKPWLPAFKGGFLILFGIIAMLGVAGTIKSLAFLFAFLAAMIGILLIATGIRNIGSRFRLWTIVSGIIHLSFFVILALRVDTAKDIYAAREGVTLLILIWLIFYAITEIVEAGILYSRNNAFSSLFIINALLTLLFAYFLNVVSGNFNVQGVFYLGVFAFILGLVNILSSYLLSRAKQNN